MQMKKDSFASTPTLAFGALAGAVSLASLGTSIAAVALPTLAHDFSADMPQVQWVVVAYLLAVTVAIAPAGRMADLFGSRRMLLGALTLFILACAGAAMAPTLGWLIAARTAQGLAAAVLMSLPMAIIKTLVSSERLGTSMGLLGTVSAIGTAMGPAIGGLLTDTFGWRSLFVLLMLCTLSVMGIALRSIPQTERAMPSKERFDWKGCFWFCAALLCLTLAATVSNDRVAALPLALMALCVTAFVLFVRTERLAVYPLIPMEIVRRRETATSLCLNVMVGSVMMATLVVGPLFLAFGLGLGAAKTGLVMAMGPLIAALSGLPAGRATDRFGAMRTLRAGLGLATAGLIALAVLPAFIGVPGYLIGMALATPGFQLFLAANNTAAMSQIGLQHRGLLSGLLGLSRTLGLLAGAALVPVFFACMLDHQLLAENSRQSVTHAFTITFLATAGLCITALLSIAQPGRRRTDSIAQR